MSGGWAFHDAGTEIVFLKNYANPQAPGSDDSRKSSSDDARKSSLDGLRKTSLDSDDARKSGLDGLRKTSLDSDDARKSGLDGTKLYRPRGEKGVVRLSPVQPIKLPRRFWQLIIEPTAADEPPELTWMRAMLAGGYQIDVTAFLESDTGSTPIHAAFAAASEQAVEIIEQAGVRLGSSLRDANGNDYLSLLLKGDHSRKSVLPLIRRLVNAGFPLTERYGLEGASALFILLTPDGRAKGAYIGVKEKEANRFAAIELLVAPRTLLENPVVTSRDSKYFGMTPLLYAMEQKYYSAVEFIVRRLKPDVNARDPFGETPLMKLCTSPIPNNLPLLELLLERGANAKATDNDGNTLFHYAAGHIVEIFTVIFDESSQQEELEFVKHLAKTGVVVNARNKYGKTFLDLFEASDPKVVLKKQQKLQLEKFVKSLDDTLSLPAFGANFSIHEQSAVEAQTSPRRSSEWFRPFTTADFVWAPEDFEKGYVSE